MTNESDIIIERIRFDIIGVTESKHELRVWTDGDRVVWQDDEGRSGYMPLMLFRLAAFTLADRCEEEATRPSTKSNPSAPSSPRLSRRCGRRRRAV